MTASSNHRPKTHQVVTLPHGLKIIGEYNPEARTVSMGFFVRTGSRDETAKESGVSHFLEHMMFKGTAKRSALQLTFDMGNIAVQANAFTSEESTVYYGTVLPEYTTSFADILCDMLRPALDEAEFSTEKKVILEEIALYEDRPQFYLFDQAMREYYGGHPAGNSVLGTTSSVAALTCQEMRDYFRRRYTPANMAFVIAGNFDWDTVCRNIASGTAAWVGERPDRIVSPHHSPGIEREYTRKGLNQNHIVLVTEGPSATDAERYELALVEMIVGDVTGSHLYWELIDTGLAEGAGADSDDRDGTGTFMVYASTQPENLSRVRDCLRSVMARVGDFTDADIARARSKMTSRLVMSAEQPMGRMMGLGMDHLYRGTLSTLHELRERLDSITRSDIERALARFPLNNLSEFRLVGSA